MLGLVELIVLLVLLVLLVLPMLAVSAVASLPVTLGFAVAAFLIGYMLKEAVAPHARAPSSAEPPLTS
ncbi:MAG: hypothetical protein GVY15_04815 [Bacteroidetes bacterium]|nr:hypothetical protein [Bacteroidota bacterium]